MKDDSESMLKVPSYRYQAEAKTDQAQVLTSAISSISFAMFLTTSRWWASGKADPCEMCVFH